MDKKAKSAGKSYEDLIPQGDRDILAEAYERYEIGCEAMDENWSRAREAIKFRDLEQWDEAVKNARANDADGARPCLVLDKVNQYVRQVTNEQRQNRPAIKVRAVDDKGDPEVAEVFRGLVRSIEDLSRADVAYDTGMEHATDGGFGYWRVCTDYADDESFDQEIRIERIRNRFSVICDPTAQQPDGSDAKWWIVYYNMTLEDYKADYPDAKVTDFEPMAQRYPRWFEGKDKVTVCEYIRCEYELSEVTNGKKTRKVKKPKWKIFTLNGAEVLDTTEWASRYGPIVRVLGSELDLDGELLLSGMVRPAMDAMRQYNYSASAFVERVALEPRVPWIGAEGQFEGHEKEWSQANRRNFAYLEYNPILEGDLLVPPPQRNAMPSIPPGWQQLLANMEHDIQTSLGMYGSNLGQQTEAQSGRQELALQRKGDVSTYHFQDNHSLAIRQTGRIIVDLIPKIYDTERVVRILGEDGDEDHVKLKPGQGVPVNKIKGKNGKIQKMFDPTVGKYDVTVTVGPSYATKRMEGAEFMMNLLQKNPNFAGVFGDIAFKSLDVPYAEEVAERIRRTIPPNILADDDEDQFADLPEEAKQVIQQMQAQMQAKDQQIQQFAQGLEQRSKELSQQEKAVASQSSSAKDDVHRAQMEIARLQAVKDDISKAEEIFRERISKLKVEQENIVLTFEKKMLEVQASDSEDKLSEVKSLWGEMQAELVASNRDMAAALNEVGQRNASAYRVVSPLTGNEYMVEPIQAEQPDAG